MMIVKKILKKIKNLIVGEVITNSEKIILLQAKVLVEQVKRKVNISSFEEVEFRCFSQFGDDGIIQWLVHNLDIKDKIFIEFGVENYQESNTKFLLINNNWSGFVMDGSKEYIESIKSRDYYWRHELSCKQAWITKENINSLLCEEGLKGEIGLLHIDLDGNDYYVWDAIKDISPSIVIVEYNSNFGDRPVSIPYDPDFSRFSAHSSGLFWGCSLKSLINLGNEKKYAFIGCNSAGNNAYFVRRDMINNRVKECSFEAGFSQSKFREARDRLGNLNYLDKRAQKKLLSGIRVYNTEKKEMEIF